MRILLMPSILLLFCVLALSACASLDSAIYPYAAQAPVLTAARPAPPAPAVLAARLPPAETRITPAASVILSAESTEASNDLMDRIREGFQIEEFDQDAIDSQLAWFANHPDYLDRTFSRAALYMQYIVEEVERRGMPMELALLPVIESAFEPYAYSRSRASGLWQFIPGTGKRFDLPQTWWYDGRRDVVESTRAALDYLQFLHDTFEGDWLLAIAGYNCGEGCVSRAVAKNRAAGRSIEFWDLRLPTETRAYVPKLLAMKRLVLSPDLFGIAFSPIPNEPYFAKVNLDKQIDLNLAAQLAGLTQEEIFELNPAFHRWATPPDGPFSLLLPLDAVELFNTNVAQLNADDLMRVTRHTVKKYETINMVAARYDANATQLRMLNKLESNFLSEGTELRVPLSRTDLPAKVVRAAALIDAPERSSRLNNKRQRPQVHVVRRGESISAIAKRNHMSVRQLLKINGKRAGQKLRTGERLKLSNARNSSEDAFNSNSKKTNSKDNPTQTSVEANQTVKHTIRRGETLSSIARRYKVSIAQVSAWNKLSTRKKLRVGQKLIIKN